MTSLIVDANLVFEIVVSPEGASVLEGQEPAALPVLWPKVRSALHVARWRGLLDDEDARRGHCVLESGSVEERRHGELGSEA